MQTSDPYLAGTGTSIHCIDPTEGDEEIPMLDFDEGTFVGGLTSAVGLRPEIEQFVDSQLVNAKNLFLIGSGGTFANMWPYEYLLRTRSTFPVTTWISSELVAAGDATLGSGSVALFTSVSGTTEDVLEAIKYCRDRGAYTVAFTGTADSPIAAAADQALIGFEEAWPFDLQLLLVLTRLLSARGEFDGYDRFVAELDAIPAALVDVANSTEERARAYAESHKNVPYYFVIGGGILWGAAYIYSMCVLEEMQWLKTTRVNSAEFFHGSLELLEEDTPVLILQGEDATRPLTDRAIEFAQRISKDVTVFDTKSYALEGISEEFRYLLGPAVIDTALKRLTKHLARVRNHPDSTRRYYRVLEY
jgi:fructoselysine-6-phosphate deglycase